MYDERYIHSGFFAGYLVMQLPVGYLCDVFGPKPFLIAGMAISSVATAIVPIMFKHSDFINLILTNGFMGVGQAVLYPGLTCLLVQWIPYQERSTGGALVFDMYGFGSVFCCLVTIVFMNHVENWMYIFYMWVIIGVIWCLLFSAFGSSGPFENDFISLRERDFLEKNLDIKAYYIQTPVTAILMDINIWAVILTNTASEMIIALQIITIPEYLNLVFRLPPYYEMILSKFPLVLITVSGMISGIISDFVISRKRCKPICVRIIMCFFGILAPSLVLLLAFHMLCNMKNFLILYTLSALLIGTYFNASILDISVNHAGFIMGLANSIGVFFSMFFCYTVKDLART
ncbi:PREDICTED: putative inorganic phosphate cotransporter, partial [Nicrophorus vespilloides]|uniref:Inorganic phosphate cotransporter n=1 Tax=Nicrophorus vespilloides TaxID=110193 RepID=A0ABM1MJ22_NICVS